MTPDRRELPASIQCVLFDVDGTLYDQGRLRSKMLLHVAVALVKGELGLRRLAVLRAYRQQLEALRRTRGVRPGGLAREHTQRVAEALRVPAAMVDSTVREWLHVRPLRFVRACAWPGLRPTLLALRAAGCRLGVLSDYPAGEKLSALGVDDCVDAAVSCQDPESDGYKPHTNGFRRLAEALAAPAEACVYVGDRLDVDIAGAAAAGMGAVWLSPRRGSPGLPDGCAHVRRFADLERLLT